VGAEIVLTGIKPRRIDGTAIPGEPKSINAVPKVGLLPGDY
jgi:hypothetical protein